MTTIQIRIDEKTKNEAKKVLDEIGINMSSAIKMYLRQITKRKKLPLDFITENGLTIQQEKEILKASKEAKQEINVSKPIDADEFIKHLEDIC